MRTCSAVMGALSMPAATKASMVRAGIGCDPLVSAMSFLLCRAAPPGSINDALSATNAPVILLSIFIGVPMLIRYFVETSVKVENNPSLRGTAADHVRELQRRAPGVRLPGRQPGATALHRRWPADLGTRQYAAVHAKADQRSGQ